MDNISTLSALDDNELTVFGFVDSIEPSEVNNKYSRLNVIFDSASVEKVIESNGVAESYDDVYIIRMMTTTKRFKKRFNINPGNIKEGEWYKITLKTRKGEPPAWILSNVNNFSGPYKRTNVIKFEKVDENTTVGTNGQLALDSLDSMCNFIPQNPIIRQSNFFVHNSEDIFVRKVDVGQGCCATFHTDKDTDSEIIGYYDVGFPLPFNKKTFPPKFVEDSRVPDRGFILLSHWDYDHYYLALSISKKLQTLTWFAPLQPGGVMATVFKKNLGANLHIVTAPRLSFDNNIEYIRSTYVGSDLNNSGYYIRIIYKQYVALMAGDIDYTYIAAADKININALAISHHGGKGSNNPPACSSVLGYAVVSYGYDNSYHHPYDANIKEHHVVGWTVLSTAETSSLPRGDRWLY